MTTYTELQNQVNSLLKKYNEEDKGLSSPYISQMESTFEKYLSENSKDTQVLIQFSQFQRSYYHDHDLAQQILLDVLKYEPNNIFAALIFAYMAFTFLHLDQEKAFRILQALKTNDRKLLSMIEYVKAFYHLNDKVAHEDFLKKSIEYCDKFVWNYVDLGCCYGEKTERGKKFIKKGLANIQSLFIYFRNMKYESKIRTKEDFVNEFITGTNFKASRYKEMLKELKKT